MLFYGIVPILFGEISKPRTIQAYQNCIYVLVIASMFANIFVFRVNYVDHRQGGILNRNENSDEVKRLKIELNNRFLGLDQASNEKRRSTVA